MALRQNHGPNGHSWQGAAPGLAEAIFESNDIALSWMLRENIALGNAKPIELCDTDEGAAQVHRVLSAIEHGNSA